jgi:acetoin utilization deacetylase AcuC-like enzyme/formylglycine-generating enzyme required for sulfatase activity
VDVKASVRSYQLVSLRNYKLYFTFCIACLVILFTSCEKKTNLVPPSNGRTDFTPTIIKTSAGKEMVQIPGGWFEMGSKKKNESPVHKVWVDSFLMDRCEVTQDEYEKLIAGNPSHFKGAKNPVEQISWSNAVLYCNARSRKENLKPCYDEETGKCNFSANGYRLPTEAEWEYACRSGTKTDYFFGRDTSQLKDYAWFADNSTNKTQPVGQKKPNQWELYDMYGNVAEWCNDIYSESYYSNSPEKNPQGPDKGKKYILKGGSWNSSAESCRSSYRIGEDPGFQDACFSRDDIGIRCVRIASKSTSLNTGNSNFQLISLNPPNPLFQRGNSMLSFQRGNGTISPFSKGDKGDLKSTQNQKSSKLKTGFIYSDIYLKHKTGPRHPEKPQRLTAIVSSLEKYLSDENSKLQLISPKPFSDTIDWLTTVHSPEYIERVKKSCQNREEYMDSIDTPISPESYEVAVMAVGGVLSAIDGVMNGKIKNAFCAVRPPGHHSLRDKAMGFCIFNNVAIGARYIQKKYGLSKVLIVDWDVHHGNGTQDAFYNDPTVLYFSAHRSPFYPGTGYADEKGIGKGLNYTINVEMTAGNGDINYKRVFENVLKPRAIEFDPDFVLISAGFDAHKDDPLGGMNVTANGYAEMTKIVKDIAEKCCDGRLVSVLEGGYSIDGLVESVDAHILILN